MLVYPQRRGKGWPSLVKTGYSKYPKCFSAGCMNDQLTFTNIPLRYVGPIVINGKNDKYSVKVPLATFETPLWPSVARGARASKKGGGITTTIVRDTMARSIVFEATSCQRAVQIIEQLQEKKEQLFAVAESTSRYLKCTDLNFRLVGSCIYTRLSGFTGDASGHNMITKAADAVLEWICKSYPDVAHISVSGNYCTDKKVSSVNAILGRGKYVVAETTLSREICQNMLKTTPEAVSELNRKKNLIGSLINGGVQSANAHFANMLLAIYLATGQDAANIVEGSQGITQAEVRGDNLYFSVSLPNVIIGTVGNGKNLEGTEAALRGLGCLEKRACGDNSRRLAEIIAATVLCGELSLLAAQTKPGELVRAHMKIERRNR
jgi:hydroxymethylglutaryl-CoA reductase (NADPH)